jgi:hypothetical protein
MSLLSFVVDGRAADALLRAIRRCLTGRARGYSTVMRIVHVGDVHAKPDPWQPLCATACRIRVLA